MVLAQIKRFKLDQPTEIADSIDERKSIKVQVWDIIKGYMTKMKLNVDETNANYKNFA